MAIGLVGRKCGMTRIFTAAGETIPVSVVAIEPNVITQVKTAETDGYSALQVTTGSRRPSRVGKPMLGHYAKNSVTPGRGTWEFRLEAGETSDLAVGGEIKMDTFSAGQMVDVTGVSKGKGYAGVIKRHHFATQDASHGNSLSHRAPGSIGQRQTPGRVFKGKRMAGHLGNVNRTVQSLEVVRVDMEKKVILIKGAIPGAAGGDVIIKPAVKG